MFARWASPEAVFGILKECSRGQPCDITGIADYAMVDVCGGVQWPLSDATPAGKPAAERRLFEDGRFHHPDGRAIFLFEAPRPMAEAVDAAFPFVLLTGRGTSSQWHTGSRTAKSDVLRQLYPENIYVEINPRDAARLGIVAGAAVAIRSRRASISATAFPTPTVQPGQIFIPMHYDAVNRLTHPSFDPYSRQPNYKACAVSVAAM